MKTVSAADANRHFSKLLREVQGGETVTITSRGKPVATIAPSYESDAKAARQAREREAALERLLRRIDSQPALYLGRFNRDDAYDD